MAIIDANGLFNGDRLRQCSTMARLYWPYLYLASNGYARLEINFPKLVTTVFGTFNPLPKQTELEQYILEYRDAHLLFLYEAGGQLWGQWDTPAELLKRYKTSEDRRSPEPLQDQFQEWISGYRNQKQMSPAISDDFRKAVGDLPKCKEISEDESRFPKKSVLSRLGVGAGVERGIGEDQHPYASTSSAVEAPETTERKGTSSNKRDSRHAAVREHIVKRICEACPDLKGSEWTIRDGSALKRFLLDHPRLTQGEICQMVDFRIASEDVTLTPAHGWIANLTRYVEGPLDRYGMHSDRFPRLGSAASGPCFPSDEVAPTQVLEIPEPAPEVQEWIDLHPSVSPWKHALTQLVVLVNKHSYDTWLKPTHFMGVGGRTIFVSVPTAEFLHVRVKYKSEIEESLQQLPGFEEVEFIVGHVELRTVRGQNRSYKQIDNPEIVSKTSAQPRLQAADIPLVRKPSSSFRKEMFSEQTERTLLESEQSR